MVATKRRSETDIADSTDLPLDPPSRVVAAAGADADAPSARIPLDVAPVQPADPRARDQGDGAALTAAGHQLPVAGASSHDHLLESHARRGSVLAAIALSWLGTLRQELQRTRRFDERLRLIDRFVRPIVVITTFAFASAAAVVGLAMWHGGWAWIPPLLALTGGGLVAWRRRGRRR